MKFNDKDFSSLKESIKAAGINVSEMRAKYDKEGKTKQRFYWDLFWISKWADSNRCHEYNDSHIETALKAAVRDLTSIHVVY